MGNSSFLGSLILAAGIGGGLIGLGVLTDQAVIQAKKAERYVTVKGISEKSVKADLGIWEIDYREVGNDLNQLSNQIAHDQDTVTQFLTKNGFQPNELEIRPAKVNDQLANPYSNPNEQAKENRYIVTAGIRVRSNNVDLIQKVSQITTELIKQGINLSFDTSDYNSDLSPNPSYFYTQLDTIRPIMLAEATRSARAVAEQFAKDSNSQLGDIRRANQGLFQISSRDGSGDSGGGNMNEARSIDKKVRLVSTIDYYLKN